MAYPSKPRFVAPESDGDYGRAAWIKAGITEHVALEVASQSYNPGVIGPQVMTSFDIFSDQESFERALADIAKSDYLKSDKVVDGNRVLKLSLAGEGRLVALDDQTPEVPAMVTAAVETRVSLYDGIAAALERDMKIKERDGRIRLLREGALLEVYASRTRNPIAMSSQIIDASGPATYEDFAKTLKSTIIKGQMESVERQGLKLTDTGRLRVERNRAIIPEIEAMVAGVIDLSVQNRQRAASALAKVGLAFPPEVLLPETEVVEVEF